MNLRNVLKSAPREVCEAAMRDAKRIVELAQMDAKLEILRRERDENLSAFNRPEKQGLPPPIVFVLTAVLFGVAYAVLQFILGLGVNIGG